MTIDNQTYAYNTGTTFSTTESYVLKCLDTLTCKIPTYTHKSDQLLISKIELTKQLVTTPTVQDTDPALLHQDTDPALLQTATPRH